MRRLAGYLGLCIGLAMGYMPASAAAQSIPLDFAALDQRVEQVREAWRIPGAAIAVVSPERDLHVRGFGVRSAEAGGAVDADTLFMVGSVSKSLSAAVLASLADAGQVRWDDRVVDHLPWFRLSDPWVGAATSIEDVLSHRVGVEATDWMDDVPGLDWAETVRRLRHLPQARPFRTGLLYDNFMYSVGGLVVASVDGDYADAARARLFVPAGMHRTVADLQRVLDPLGVAPCNECLIVGGGLPPGEALRGVDNVALPHAVVDGRLQLLPWPHQSSISAGSALSSAHDLGRYLRMLLGGGSIDGRRVLSADAVAELGRSRINAGGSPAPPLPGFEEAQRRIARMNQHYSLGWFLGEYAGVRIIHHAGAMLGGSAQTAMLPEQGIGVAVLANQRLYSMAATDSILYEALDRVLGLAPVDWIGYFRALEARAASQPTPVSAAAPRARHGRADDVLAGDYCHPAYGVVHLRTEGKSLRVDQGEPRVGVLSRQADGAFAVRWKGARNEPRPVDFEFDAAGRPLAIRITGTRFPACEGS